MVLFVEVRGVGCDRPLGAQSQTWRCSPAVNDSISNVEKTVQKIEAISNAMVSCARCLCRREMLLLTINCCPATAIANASVSAQAMVIVPPSLLHDCILCKIDGFNPPPHATAVVLGVLYRALLLLFSKRRLDNSKGS